MLSKKVSSSLLKPLTVLLIIIYFADLTTLNRLNWFCGRPLRCFEYLDVSSGIDLIYPTHKKDSSALIFTIFAS